MNIYLVDTQEILSEQALRERFNYVSFPINLTEEDLLVVGAKLIKPSEKPITLPNQILIENGVELIGEDVFQKWEVRNLTSEQIIEKITEYRKKHLLKINNDDNKIYADVIGNKTTEYLKAAEDARAFKAAGYPENAVPDYVQSWADAKLWTARQACDDIINQELLWQGAAKLIRDYRLKAKESVKRATTIEEVEAAMLIWNGFVVSIRTQLGVG